MKKILGFLLIILLFISGCQQKEIIQEEIIQEDIKSKEIDYKYIEGVFGFADESGKKLITLERDIRVLENAEYFNIAIGNNGQIIKIKYVKDQASNDQDTYRQISHNFDNMAGYIYEVEEGILVTDKTYLLSKNSIINEDMLIKLKSTRNNESENEDYEKVDSETIEKIQSIKDRKIIDSRLISQTDDNAKICIVVFERIDNDMLASVVYIKEDKVIFKDYPAVYDENSTWRVDGGDEPGLFEVMFLANSDEGILLGLTWSGAEGENIFILKESNGVFEETQFISYRYWSPF